MARAASRYSYDVGSFGDINRRTESNRLFGRLDFNLSQDHQFTLRHNYVDAFDDNITRSSTQLRFGNNAYQFNNTTNSTVAELNSCSGAISNKLLLSYTRIRDSRDTPGELFPTFEINEDGRRYTFGTERRSGFNELDQDIYEFTDNIPRALGKDTVTVGTHNELFSFRNLFINNGVGYYQFRSLNAFLNSQPNRVQAAYPTANNGEAKLEAFIRNDPYLHNHRGKYAERFVARTPWTHQIHIRVAQDFNFVAGGKKNTIQVSFDVQNVGNLLNNDWGNQY